MIRSRTERTWRGWNMQCINARHAARRAALSNSLGLQFANLGKIVNNKLLKVFAIILIFNRQRHQKTSITNRRVFLLLYWDYLHDRSKDLRGETWRHVNEPITAVFFVSNDCSNMDRIVWRFVVSFSCRKRISRAVVFSLASHLKTGDRSNVLFIRFVRLNAIYLWYSQPASIASRRYYGDVGVT